MIAKSHFFLYVNGGNVFQSSRIPWLAPITFVLRIVDLSMIYGFGLRTRSVFISEKPQKALRRSLTISIMLDLNDWTKEIRHKPFENHDFLDVYMYTDTNTRCGWDFLRHLRLEKCTTWKNNALIAAVIRNRFSDIPWLTTFFCQFRVADTTISISFKA